MYHLGTHIPMTNNMLFPQFAKSPQELAGHALGELNRQPLKSEIKAHPEHIMNSKNKHQAEYCTIGDSKLIFLRRVD